MQPLGLPGVVLSAWATKCASAMCRALPPPLDLEDLRPPTPVDLSRPQGDWRLVSLAASAMLPHPDKLDTGGEDACFVNSLGQGAFGVADGVGGWAADGIDPAPFSRWAV